MSEQTMSNTVFGFEQPEQSPGFLLWQVTLSWQRAIQATLLQHSITHPQFVVLAVTQWFIEQGEIVIQRMLIEKTKLDKMTVSKTLQQLATLGLVTRAEHPTDTRAKTVQLTSNGKKLIKRLIPIVEQTDKAFFSNLNKEQENKFTTILRQLV